jgi:hypothetical protein
MTDGPFANQRRVDKDIVPFVTGLTRGNTLEANCSLAVIKGAPIIGKPAQEKNSFNAYSAFSALSKKVPVESPRDVLCVTPWVQNKTPLREDCFARNQTESLSARRWTLKAHKALRAHTSPPASGALKAHTSPRDKETYAQHFPQPTYAAT